MVDFVNYGVITANGHDSFIGELFLFVLFSCTGVHILNTYINYIYSYRKFTQLLHAIIRNALSIIVSERGVIYYNYLIKILFSANFYSQLFLSYIFRSISVYTT